MKAGLVVAMMLSATAASAQETYYWPVERYDAAAPRLALPIGTPVMLATRTALSTKDDLKSGQRVFLRVMEDVSYEGQVLIPSGSPAFGEVTYAERNGHFGKRGSLAIGLLYVQTPSGPVQLTGDASNRGHSGTALSIGTMAFATSLGFLIHGTSGKLPAMTPIQGYLASPLKFTVRRPAPAAAAVKADQNRSAATRLATVAD